MSSKSTIRPRDARLWVPGIAYVTPAGDLRVGPSAGYQSREPSLSRSRCGYPGRVTDWTHVAWLVARADLRDDQAAAFGVVLPESLIDPEAQPHAHRWMREQPLIAVSGATWEQLVADGLRLYLLAFDATGDRMIRVDATGGSLPPSSAVVAEDALQAATTSAWGGRSLFEVQGDPSAVDRLLRLLSNGVVDEAAVLNAVDARRLVEDGYGYRGALEGSFRGLDELARDLRPLDAVFGQVFERADAMRADAEAVVAALAACPTDEAELRLVGHGLARQALVPPLRLPDVDRLVVAGEKIDHLELPAERRWSVSSFDTWSPELAAG